MRFQVLSLLHGHFVRVVAEGEHVDYGRAPEDHHRERPNDEYSANYLTL